MRELRSMMLANARADLLGFPSVVAGSESADDRVRRTLMNASGSDGPVPPRAASQPHRRRAGLIARLLCGQ
jgi:hypothetical protein